MQSSHRVASHGFKTSSGQRATIYDVGTTWGSDPAGLIATMLATQRPTQSLASIMASESLREQLAAALQAMEHAQPPEKFMGKYIVVEDRRSGGQATVQFVRGGAGGFFQYAVKCAAWRPSRVVMHMRLTVLCTAVACRSPNLLAQVYTVGVQNFKAYLPYSDIKDLAPVSL